MENMYNFDWHVKGLKMYSVNEIYTMNLELFLFALLCILGANLLKLSLGNTCQHMLALLN